MTPPPTLPYATSGLPGCGGLLKQAPEDFVVEELPKYLPAGSGEHLYLWIEKRGLSTADVTHRICRELGLAPGQVGRAGLKDARALTRQWLSLHSPAELPLHRLECPELRILRVARHGNKLRPGHLTGNRFHITVRDAAPPAEFTELADKLGREGFPNYFGEQRLGADNRNAREGKSLVAGAFARRIPPDRARFLTNAYQAALFNALLARRLLDTEGLGHMLAGDVAVFHASSSCFAVHSADLPNVQTRAGEGEISPSAPLFGYKVLLAEGRPGTWERELLATEGLELSAFRAHSKRLSAKGERRPVRAFAQDFSWELGRAAGAPCLRISFTLQAGVYATCLLRELMKNDALGYSLPQATPQPQPQAPHAP